MFLLVKKTLNIKKRRKLTLHTWIQYKADLKLTCSPFETNCLKFLSLECNLDRKSVV